MHLLTRGLRRALRAVPALPGAALGLLFAVTALLRRSKPLHPVGIVAEASLVVVPGAPGAERSGSSLLDEPGAHRCLVRASYAVGTGPEHADIEGFAIRVLPAHGATPVADLLFASTGTGPWTRRLLTPRPAATHAEQTTLTPVRCRGRALQLRLDPVDPLTQPWPSRYRLSWSHGTGPWHPFGTLSVTADDVDGPDGPDDAPERFDPVIHPLPGTSQYPVIARLREPAYRFSRLARPSAGRLP